MIRLRENSVKLLPQKCSKSGTAPFYVHEEMTAIAKEMSIISILKHLMESVEKIVLINSNSVEGIEKKSGEYSVISNLGSYIPRFIYANIEVNMRCCS